MPVLVIAEVDAVDGRMKILGIVEWSKGPEAVKFAKKHHWRGNIKTFHMYLNELTLEKSF